MFKEEIYKVIKLLENNKYVEAFTVLNSIKYNNHDEFMIDVPKYFRVGQLERKNHRGYMFHLYFIDVYDNNPMCYFYRTLGKLYTNIDTDISEIPVKDIKKYFIPQFIEILKMYLKEEK